MNLERLDGQNKHEISMIEVAHEILAETNQVHDFNHLLEEIQNYLGLDNAELERRMVEFYTALNTDGSFISLGDNRWGLRSWYPLDAINEELINSMDDEEIKKQHKARRKKKTNVFATSPDDDMIDYNDDDPEDHDDYDEDEYDDVDEIDEDDEYEGTEPSDDDEAADELYDYQDDLEELGEEEGDDLDDGLEGDLRVIEEDEDEEEDLL